ncbi:MAG: GntR family transcriptional regulator [Rhodospirillales bacterium]
MASLGTVIRETLEHEIVTGLLAPGSRLDEVGLAERFNASRTPVREALHHLGSIGLVEIRPRRGAVVAAIGLRDLVEMFEVMAELEAVCARLAARRMSHADIARLEAAHHACLAEAERSNPDAYYQANIVFHEAIYEGSRNAYLARKTLALRNRLAPYRRLQLRRPRRLDESYAEHEAIVSAIKTRDEERAGSLISDHVTVQGGSFNDFLSGLEPVIPARLGAAV